MTNFKSDYSDHDEEEDSDDDEDERDCDYAKFKVDIDKNQQEEDANYFDEDDLGERKIYSSTLSFLNSSDAIGCPVLGVLSLIAFR